MLVHICCSVDSHYFLQQLRKELPDEPLVGFFYNPNIHPHEEYKLRLMDAKRSCAKLGVKLLDAEYDYEGWLKACEGLETEPEKGARCGVCFAMRFERTAKEAAKLGEGCFTSTLLQSPMKDPQQLKEAGEKIAEAHGVEFHFYDFGKDGGRQRQNEVVKSEQLYRQNYCGCMYGLLPQRQAQNRPALELFSPITKEVLDGSVHERINIFDYLSELQQEQKQIKLYHYSFLNYRLMYGQISVGGRTLPSFILPYSKSYARKFKAQVEFEKEGIYYLSKEGAVVIGLARFNELAKTDFLSVAELSYSSFDFAKALSLRAAIFNLAFVLSPVFVLDDVDAVATYEISLDSAVFEDRSVKAVEI